MAKRKLFRKIDISSVSGIDKAIAFLQDNLSKEVLQEKVDEVASALIADGQAAAEQVYPESVQVEAINETGVHKLIAEHDGIAFIEFGAGYAVDGSTAVAGATKAQSGMDISIGSYSREHEGEFSKTGHWHFGGHVYEEIQPRPGMEYARITIEDNAEKKLKEVFGVD